MARLGDIFEITSGGTPDRSKTEYYSGGTIPWIKTGDLKGKYVSKEIDHITPEGLNNSSAKLFPVNTVLVAMYGATIGACSILPYEAATNQACAAFLPNEKVLPEYLYYYLCGKKEKFIKDGVGGAQPNISAGYLKKVDFRIVTLNKQKEIIALLSKLDNIITLRQKQLQKLDDLVKARFVEMFGDMADPACKWPVCRLIEACEESDDIKCGPFGTQLSKDEYQKSGIPVWEIPQINSAFAIAPEHYLSIEKAQQLRAYSLSAGDIVMSRKGNVGKCAIFPADKPDGILHSDVLRIRVSSKITNPCFMMCQLHFSRDIIRQIEKVSSGAIMAGVNVTKLKDIVVKMPPLEIQDQFAAFVSQVDKSKLSIQQGLEKLETLKKSLMQQYFG